MSSRKISKVELCRTLHIGRTTLDAVLKGSDARISTIESIAHALGSRVGYLFNEEPIEQYQARDNAHAVKMLGGTYHEAAPAASGADAALADQLTAQCAQLSAQVDTLAADNASLRSDNRRLASELSAAKDKIIALLEQRPAAATVHQPATDCLP